MGQGVGIRKKIFVWAALIIGATAAVAIAVAFLGPISDALANHDVRTIPATARPEQLRIELNAVRGMFLQIGAGLLALGAFVYTARNFTLSRRAHELTAQGQVTDRYTRAIDQLGSDKPDIRIGGIYALERTAWDSVRDHGVIMDALAAFVRRKTRDAGDNSGDWPPADVRAAMTVIARRNLSADRGPIDLHGADLRGIRLDEVQLVGAMLGGIALDDAHMTGATLTGATLDDAHMTGATLTGATLDDAHMTGATLTGATLDDAHMTGATLTGATLDDAHMTGATLTGATLDDAHMVGAKLQSIFLSGAVLAGADLSRSDFSQGTLRQVNFSGANLAGANLSATDLTGADFTNAILTDSDMRKARADGAISSTPISSESSSLTRICAESI